MNHYSRFVKYSVVDFTEVRNFPAIKPEEAVREISVPVFIIHGEQDDMVSVQHAYRLKDASQNPDSKLWIVPKRNTGTHIL